MEKLKSVKLSKDTIVKVVVAIIAVICISLIISVKANGENENEEVAYDYTEMERQLAESVKLYLTDCVVLETAKSSRIADAAVQSYRTIMESGIKNVMDEHTEALEQLINSKLKEEILPEQVEETGYEPISAGICTIIWDTVLSQLDKGNEGEDAEEAVALYSSIQAQIDSLKKRNMTVSISTSNEGGVTAEELKNRDANLLSNISNNLSDSLSGIKSDIIKEFENKYGKIEDGKDGTAGKDGATGSAGKTGATGTTGATGSAGKDGAKGKDGSAGKDGVNGKDGAAGKDGVNGKDGAEGKEGATGKDGAAGKDGTDGLSTYYMFSETADGQNMTPTQTNKTKYMGIAHSSEKQAPADPSAYTWSEYKDYIIFSDTDAGVPTVYIQ